MPAIFEIGLRPAKKTQSTHGASAYNDNGLFVLDMFELLQ